ncbi:MAG: NYN domain-containing protein [Planctomycetes bacterium]|nr:NYN domain-containing protein [Planctomycetota bacterium]
MDPRRVVVFIDARNVYHRARGAFFTEVAHGTCGNVHPVKLAELLVSRPPPGSPKDRRLEEVRVYTGRPSAVQDPDSHAAHMRQCVAWEREGADVIYRPLRYRPGAPPREKGIDVQLAIDFVAYASDDRLDVGVIVSADSDLAPAVEFVKDRPQLGKTVEVAAWFCPPHAKAKIPGAYCHLLDWFAFSGVRDRRDYTTGRLHYDDPTELQAEVLRVDPPAPPAPPAAHRR